MTIVDRDQLLASARDFGDLALRAYVKGDERLILTNAAIAMEHVSKAFLFGLHPTLLVELRNAQLDSLLHLAGLSAKARKLPYPRTIGGKEALARVEYLLPSLKTPRDLLGQLVDVRDGMIHVGYLSPSSTRELLTSFLRFAEELYDEMGVTSDARWGDHKDLVSTLILQSVTETEHEANRKFVAAKRRYFDLMKDIPKNLQSGIRSARIFQEYDRSKSLPYPHQKTPVICPACDNDHAQIRGMVDYGQHLNPLIERQPDPMPSQIYLRITIALHDFRCTVCELDLSGPDELIAVGLPTEMERWLLIWDEDGSPAVKRQKNEKVRAYGTFQPVGARPAPYPQHPDGYFASSD